MARKTKPDPIAKLPFVGNRSAPKGDELPRSFWSVRPSDQWDSDCRTGISFGMAAIEAMRLTGCIPLLGWIVADQIRGGEQNGLVIGFWSAVSSAIAGEIAAPRTDSADQPRVH